jgi:hypothetical protein
MDELSREELAIKSRKSILAEVLEKMEKMENVPTYRRSSLTYFEQLRVWLNSEVEKGDASD